MNHDWPWLAVVALAIPAGLGHLYHLILSINMASGLGYRESAMDRVRTALFASFWVSSALLLWVHLQTPWWTWSWPARGYAVLCVISGSGGLAALLAGPGLAATARGHRSCRRGARARRPRRSG